MAILATSNREVVSLFVPSTSTGGKDIRAVSSEEVPLSHKYKTVLLSILKTEAAKCQ